MTGTVPSYTREEFIQKVGNTPLVKFESLSNAIGRNIYFKCEYHNPGGTIKDRVVIELFNDVISSGKISPGGTLVESTAGGTGVSIAILARAFTPAFKVVLFLPDCTGDEKINLLKSLGCEIVKCPSNVAPDHPEFFTNAAKTYAESTPNAVYLNQMGNLSNRKAHYNGTGPEIWRALDGKVDGFVASAGTGGTFMGIASYFKDMTNGATTCWFADKDGSGLCHFIKTKGQDGWKSEGESFVEGIGKHTLTGNMHDALMLADDAVTINDTDAIVTIYQVIDEHDCWIGASGGLNICAARELALTLPEGSNVVTTIADGSEKYASRIFSRSWLEQNGHWDHIPKHLRDKYATYDEPLYCHL